MRPSTPRRRSPYVLRPIGRDPGPLDIEERADRHHALEVLRRHLVRRQILGIHRQQRGEVGPGGVADDEQLPRIAAVFGGVRARPRHRMRRILDVGRMRHARRQPVVDDHRDEPGFREQLADVGVAGLVPLAQRAAVDRDDTGAPLAPAARSRRAIFFAATRPWYVSTSPDRDRGAALGGQRPAAAAARADGGATRLRHGRTVRIKSQKLPALNRA